MTRLAVMWPLLMVAAVGFPPAPPGRQGAEVALRLRTDAPAQMLRKAVVVRVDSAGERSPVPFRVERKNTATEVRGLGPCLPGDTFIVLTDRLVSEPLSIGETGCGREAVSVRLFFSAVLRGRVEFSPALDRHTAVMLRVDRCTADPAERESVGSYPLRVVGKAGLWEQVIPAGCVLSHSFALNAAYMTHVQGHLWVVVPLLAPGAWQLNRFGSLASMLRYIGGGGDPPAVQPFVATPGGTTEVEPLGVAIGRVDGLKERDHLRAGIDRL